MRSWLQCDIWCLDLHKDQLVCHNAWSEAPFKYTQLDKTGLKALSSKTIACTRLNDG